MVDFKSSKYTKAFFSLSRLIDLSSDELLSQNKLLPSPKSAKNLQVPKLTIKKVEECGDCIEDKRRAPFKRQSYTSQVHTLNI